MQQAAGCSQVLQWQQVQLNKLRGLVRLSVVVCLSVLACLLFKGVREVCCGGAGASLTDFLIVVVHRV